MSASNSPPTSRRSAPSDEDDAPNPWSKRLRAGPRASRPPRFEGAPSADTAARSAAPTDGFGCLVQPELRLGVMEYLDLRALPPRLALAGIDRSWREFVYRGRHNLWAELNFDELVPFEFESSFDDDALRLLLVNINARDCVSRLAIDVGNTIVGDGLAPICGSRILRELYIYCYCARSSKGQSPITKLLSSLMSKCSGPYERGSRFSLQEVVLEGAQFTKREKHALHRLEARMKSYWTCPGVKCSHCGSLVESGPEMPREKGDLVGDGLLSDDFRDIERVYVCPKWICVHCFKTTCGRGGECPELRCCDKMDGSTLRQCGSGPSCCGDFVSCYDCHNAIMCKKCTDPEAQCQCCGLPLCSNCYGRIRRCVHSSGVCSCCYPNQKCSSCSTHLSRMCEKCWSKKEPTPIFSTKTIALTCAQCKTQEERQATRNET